MYMRDRFRRPVANHFADCLVIHVFVQAFCSDRRKGEREHFEVARYRHRYDRRGLSVSFLHLSSVDEVRFGGIEKGMIWSSSEAQGGSNFQLEKTDRATIHVFDMTDIGESSNAPRSL